MVFSSKVLKSILFYKLFLPLLGYLNSDSDSQTSVSPHKDALELNENMNPSSFEGKEEDEGLLDDGSNVNEDQGSIYKSIHNILKFSYR